MDREERRMLFHEELQKLREEHLITLREYTTIKKAYTRYFNAEEEKTAVPIKETEPEFIDKPSSLKPAVVQKPKRNRSPQETRDRNITWVLILGVVLLLIGGLVLATSNWEAMTAALKTALIAAVCGLFFGISWLSGEKLNIKKTAFAFLTLGSLFLPIVILSAGYFQLFGFWLSVFGPGKYILGLIGTLLGLPLYSFHAKRHNSRLFVWFTYLTLSIGIGFLIASFYPPIDYFYLGIVSYNALLIVGYYRYKETKTFAVFLRELPVFSQVNLVLSTLLMLLFFESPVFYSFNVLLTAVIYLAMIFTANRKEYYFIFTVLLVYGMYQLIEHSFLQSIDVILYALIGFIFIGLQTTINEHNSYLQKAFQFTSAVVSFCAFLFISYKGILLRFDEPSWLLFFGYLIICVNYIFLAYETKFRLFSFLAPVFFAVAGLQLMSLLYDQITANMFAAHTFGIGILLFVTGYFYNKWKFTLPIKYSSLFVSIGAMVLATCTSLFMSEWYTGSSLFILFGIIMYYTSLSIKEERFKKLTAWLNPISWLLAGMVLYPEFTRLFQNYETTFGLPFQFGIVGILLLGISMTWKAGKQYKWESSTFWTAQAAYALSIVLLFTESINPLYTRSGLLLVGIGMYYLVVKRTKKKKAWLLVSLLTLASYLSIIDGLQFDDELLRSLQWIGGALLLMVISETIGKKNDTIKNSFFYNSHLYLPVALGITLIDGFDRPVSILIALTMYGYSVWKRKNEWERKLFLYAGFTVIPLFLLSLIDFFDLHYEFGNYTLFTASFIILAMWAFMNNEWKQRIKWYLVPLSILGTAEFGLNHYRDPTIAFTIGMIYTAMVLYVMHRSNWHVLTLLPLLISLNILDLLIIENKTVLLIIYIGAAFASKTTGSLLFRYLYEKRKTTWLTAKIDWYALTALLILIKAHGFINYYSPLWLKEIPALALSLLFYSQIRRVKEELSLKIVKTITMISFLYPYYVLLNNISINRYIETEAYLLPWLALTIVLSKGTWADKKQAMNIIHWIVLIIIAALLVQDALRSSTVYDALITGGLSLFSVLGGLHYRVKSYLFVGSGVLLLNVLLQTRPFWGSMPWWAYLLIAGFTLITGASIYEWQKQQKDDDGNTFLQKKKKQWADKWKQWN